MSIIYNPPAPHRCDLPDESDLRNGAIAQCDTCHAFSQLTVNHYQPDVRSWRKLTMWDVIIYRFLGFIPMPKTETQS